MPYNPFGTAGIPRPLARWVDDSTTSNSTITLADWSARNPNHRVSQVSAVGGASSSPKSAPLENDELEDTQIPDLEEQVPRKTRLINKFLIGCDPEFAVLHKNGSLVRLSSLGIIHSGKLGYDHSGWCGELRPSPAQGTYKLLKNLREIILNERRDTSIRRYRWRGGAIVRQNSGNPLTLGGHIHFGFPVSRVSPKISALDVLARLLEELDILPRIESRQRRDSASGYGSFGDIRDKDRRLEYRTMASWLTTPAITFLILTAAKLAVAAPKEFQEILEREQSFRALIGAFELFKGKDDNADRALERLLPRGHKYLQVDPKDKNILKEWKSVDF